MTRIPGATAIIVAGGAALLLAQGGGPGGQGRGRGGQSLPPPVALAAGNAMNNPYRMLESWPHLGDIRPGAAIGIIPDGQGGVWLQHRSVPAILHIDTSGNILKKFDVTFSSSHGFCQDQDGNFWAADSGPFNDSPDAGVKGNQVFKFDQNGKLLLTLGKAGVGKAGPDTFLQPSACRATPDGHILIADGHWPRPTAMQQDGDRLVWFTRDGKFVKEFGRYGRKPGEFMGPHGLAFDSQGRLFVADRSNNRIQIFDKDMNVVDSWTQFGRPSGIWILKDDTLIVSDSESNYRIGGPDDAPEGGGNAIRNPGWKNGIRIGSAKDGSLKYFIEGTRPEGLAADEQGNIFGGLTAGCDASKSGGCLQKFVPVSQRQGASAPLTIQKQGSFAVGGTILGDPQTRSLHCDHGYVDYQIPVDPRRINLVMWHSAAATAFLNRWDGGEGYQSIFLRRGFPVYIWDGPQIGRANWGCTEHAYKPGVDRDQANFVAWRFGTQYPNWFKGVQFPTQDAEAWNQASRARYLEFDTIENAQLQSDAAAKLMDRIGPSVAITNSAGGMRAILTALKTNNIAAIVMYENVGYVYPQGEGPGVPQTGFGPIEVPLAEFKKLAKVPMQMVWGDNVDKSASYTNSFKMSQLFAEKINKYGGKAQVLRLPDAGLEGNTHIPFADMNNVAVADLLSKFLAEHGLDKR